jgi:hypothetical protein
MSKYGFIYFMFNSYHLSYDNIQIKLKGGNMQGILNTTEVAKLLLPKLYN